MVRSTEELYTRFYATALQTIADARDLDKYDFEGQRELARRTAEMCVQISKETLHFLQELERISKKMKNQ